MNIPVNLGKDSYDIVLEQGCLAKAGELLKLDRKVLIVTDSGVPEIYAKTVAGMCKEAVIEVVPEGEDTKCLEVYGRLLQSMLDHSFSRKDCVVAVGGGMCGDLAGFTAASFMRGVDFYNIPTTVLSQVDSSIGGKTAINLGNIKNIVGAFYQPKRVLIDIDVLKTLSKRQIAAGLCEAFKMSINFDPELFGIFENGSIEENIELIIEKSLRIKADVVEKDEKEQGLRKVLNFGHTIGHGIEAQVLGEDLYHGECVAIGMVPMCSEELRARVVPILEKLGLPTSTDVSLNAVCEAMLHDKKASSGTTTIIESDKIGTFKERKVDAAELRRLAAIVVKGA